MTIRMNPGSLRGKPILIPLLSQIDDPEFAATLAKATVCGSYRNCTATFSNQPPSAEEINALLNFPSPTETR